MGTRTYGSPDLFHEAPARGLRAFLARRWRTLLFSLAVIIGAAVFLVSVKWAQDAERRALLRMDPRARRTMFEEAQRNAEAMCSHAQGEPALSDRCIDAAQFLLAFPECDDACVGFARRHERKATR